MPALRAIHASTHEVVAVLTRPPARQGRGRTLKPSPVEVVARELGLEVLTPASLRDEASQQLLAQLEFEVAPVVAYGNIIPPELLGLPKYGWINLHFSLLPRWRGAAPVQRALAAGDVKTGTSVFQIEAGLDTGPVFSQEETEILPNETTGDLLERLSFSGSEQLVATLDDLAARRANAIAQAGDGITLAPKLHPAEAEVRWEQSALTIANLIRAATPSPGAWTTLPTGARMRLGPVTITELPPTAAAGASSRQLAPGQVWVTRREIWVGTGTAPVLLGLVAPAGKQLMDATAWARGARCGDDYRLGGQQ